MFVLKHNNTELEQQVTIMTMCDMLAGGVRHTALPAPWTTAPKPNAWGTAETQQQEMHTSK
jgi:hypothetical protein